MARFQADRPAMVQIGDFAPDNPSVDPSLVLDMTGAVPRQGGYSAHNAPTPYASALPETPLGGYVAMYGDGTVSVLAAGPTHIYRWNGSTWNVAGGPYVVAQRWRFTQFNDDVIAFNGDIAAPQVAAGPAGTFANLG